MMRLWPEFCRDDRGNMAILFAFGFTVSAIVSALAVDAASLYHERRAVQAGVDLAAISAAVDPSRAAEIAQSVLAEARLLAPASTDGLTVVTGNYDPTRPDIDSRFAPGGAPVNAVSVALTRTGKLHFAGHFAPEPVIAARGIATVAPEVSLSVGSRLAGLNGGIVNAILSGLLGSSVSLSLADYAALANLEVDLLPFLDALGARLGVTVGSYDELLQLNAPAGTLVGALADVANGTVGAVLHALAGGSHGNSIPLSQLLDLGRVGGLQLGSADAAVAAKVSALDLLTAAAAVADGDHQVSLKLGAGVPGLVNIGLDLVVGEREQHNAWLMTGKTGATLRTAQLRLRLRAELLGGPILLGAGVKLPLWLDVAHTEARVSGATCPTPSAPRGSATIEVRPGALMLALREMDDTALANMDVRPLPGPVNIVDVLLLKVRGSAHVEIAQLQPVALHFTSADIAAGTRKTASTTTPLSSLVGSLLGDLDLTVNILGLGLSSPTVIAKAVRDLLMPLTSVLDEILVGTLKALGVSLGAADVRVHEVRCDYAVLVG